MKWKIQAEGPLGWGDLKASYDNGATYVDDHYETKAEAEAECRDLTKLGGGYRVVTADTPSDYDYY